MGSLGHPANMKRDILILLLSSLLASAGATVENDLLNYHLGGDPFDYPFGGDSLTYPLYSYPLDYPRQGDHLDYPLDKGPKGPRGKKEPKKPKDPKKPKGPKNPKDPKNPKTPKKPTKPPGTKDHGTCRARFDKFQCKISRDNCNKEAGWHAHDYYGGILTGCCCECCPKKGKCTGKC